MHALGAHAEYCLSGTKKANPEPNRGNPKPFSSMRKYPALFHAESVRYADVHNTNMQPITTTVQGALWPSVLSAPILRLL